MESHLPVYEPYEHEDFFGVIVKFMTDYVVYLGDYIKDICVKKRKDKLIYKKNKNKTKCKDRLRLV